MHGEIDLWIKIAYTALLAVILPTYAVWWGWRNFLWFSDIALITTGVALWLDNSLLASMMALAVLVPELLWTASYFGRLLFSFFFFLILSSPFSFFSSFSLLFFLLLFCFCLWAVACVAVAHLCPWLAGPSLSPPLHLPKRLTWRVRVRLTFF